MKKKILIAVVAVMLICAICTMGTVAYLTATSNGGDPIVNTFVASAGLIENPGDDPEGNGFFILEDDEENEGELTTTGNEYTVMPGVPISKDPYIHIDGKTEIPSYLFLEVADTLDDELSWDIDESLWLDTGLTNGDNVIYVYKEVISDDLDAHIIVDGQITVSGDYAAEDGGSLSFNGYLCQEASFEASSPDKYIESAAAAFSACFAD